MRFIVKLKCDLINRNRSPNSKFDPNYQIRFFLTLKRVGRNYTTCLWLKWAIFVNYNFSKVECIFRIKLSAFEWLNMKDSFSEITFWKFYSTLYTLLKSQVVIKIRHGQSNLIFTIYEKIYWKNIFKFLLVLSFNFPAETLYIMQTKLTFYDYFTATYNF